MHNDITKDYNTIHVECDSIYDIPAEIKKQWKQFYYEWDIIGSPFIIKICDTWHGFQNVVFIDSVNILKN